MYKDRISFQKEKEQMKQSREEYLKKRREIAEKLGMRMCECGGLMYDVGDKLVCGDCNKKIEITNKSYHQS